MTVKESMGQGPWHHVLHVYDPGQTSFVLPEGRTPGVRRYRIKACRFPSQCSDSVEWPPLAAPAGEQNRAGGNNRDASEESPQ